MSPSEDLLRLLIGAHALTRLAALDARNDAPAAQWRTLMLLRDNGPQRIGDLARLSRITQPGMTRLAGTMADAGLIEKRADAGDLRATVLTATPAGLDALDRWIAELSAELEPRFTDLDDEDWSAIARTAGILARKTAAVEVAR